MVINQRAKITLEKIGLQQVVSHNWWLYQLIKGIGGVVFYDPQPSLLYRQHNGALVGHNADFKAKLDRIIYVLNERYKVWNTLNYQALYSVRHLLTGDIRYF